MRPGQTAPECADIRAIDDQADGGFNEAGADCPGMQIEKMGKLMKDHLLQ